MGRFDKPHRHHHIWEASQAIKHSADPIPRPHESKVFSVRCSHCGRHHPSRDDHPPRTSSSTTGARSSGRTLTSAGPATFPRSCTRRTTCRSSTSSSRPARSSPLRRSAPRPTWSSAESSSPRTTTLALRSTTRAKTVSWTRWSRERGCGRTTATSRAPLLGVYVLEWDNSFFFRGQGART